MKVLQLFYKVPFPADDGGAVAILSSAQGLLAQPEVELKILAMDLRRSPAEHNRIPEEFARRTRLEICPVDNRIKPAAAAWNLLTRSSYFVSRFDSSAFRKRLIACLQQERFDLIQLEHLYLGVYLQDIRQHAQAPVVLRAQNVEHLLWRSILQGPHNPLSRAFLSIATRRLQAFEESVVAQVDGVLTLSEEDASAFRQMARSAHVEAVPIGVPSRYFEPHGHRQWPAMYHLGSMDWRPNIEGVRWFLEAVWPELKSAFPGLQVHLAGKRMGRAFRQLASEDLRVGGWVEDALAYQNQFQVLFVPLLSGNGIRVKILQAMALRQVVISTSKGMEGIPARPGIHYLRADSPAEFRAAVQACWESASFREAMGLAAQNLARTQFGEAALGRRMHDFHRSLLPRPGSIRPHSESGESLSRSTFAPN